MTRHPAGEAPIPAEVAERAVEWLVELSQDVPESLRREWQSWRAAHTDHERAWQRIEAVNGRMQRLSSPVHSVLAHAALETPPSAGRRKAVRALAVFLFAGGGVWTLQRSPDWQVWTAEHRTAIGERRTLMLADGTSLTLNTDSAVDVVYGVSQRRVQLRRGEVLIATAPDAAGRPFLVTTAQGEALALGTRFTVRQRESVTQVAVFEGAVRLTPDQAPEASAVLPAGRQARLGARAVEAITVAEAGDAAWSDGLLIAKGMRVVDFLAELGRYSPRALSCTPDVAELRISGSYPVDDVDAVLRAAAGMFGLRIDMVRRFWGREAVRLSRSPDAGISGG